jgi:26S proteasome non-ATPase regulatory subunit 10
VALLKAGAGFEKKDADGILALDLAPDKEVRRGAEGHCNWLKLTPH